MTHSAVHQHTPSTEPERLGPGDLVWEVGGDRRVYLMGPPAGVLQNMLPGVSAAITEQSVFFDEPWERTMRSIRQIIDSLYDPDLAVTIRDYHRDLKGVDHHGERFHALDPQLFTAAHAVFVYTVMATIETFHHRLTDAERDAVYEQTKAWYASYGVSTRALPDTWAEFTVYWDRLCSDVFEATPSAQRIVDELFRGGMDLRPKAVPRPIWWLVGPVIASHARLMTAAVLPDELRRKLGLRYSAVDRVRFAALVRGTNLAWRLVPEQRRMTQVARRAHAAHDRTG